MGLIQFLFAAVLQFPLKDDLLCSLKSLLRLSNGIKGFVEKREVGPFILLYFVKKMPLSELNCHRTIYNRLFGVNANSFLFSS